ncbi:MAG: hypothetical protein WC547_08505 [Candidatus Omnitrophota bacterium]
MRNKKVIILIVLSLAAVFSLIYGIASSSRTKYKPSLEEKTGAEGIQSVEGSFRHAKRSGYEYWGRTPFSLAPIKAFQGLILEGIVWDNDKPVAIINGSVVKIGDTIDEHIVVDIKPDRVILNDGSKEFELKL